MPASACNSAPHLPIPPYYEFATHTVTAGDNTALARPYTREHRCRSAYLFLWDLHSHRIAAHRLTTCGL